MLLDQATCIAFASAHEVPVAIRPYPEDPRTRALSAGQPSETSSSPIAVPEGFDRRIRASEKPDRSVGIGLKPISQQGGTATGRGDVVDRPVASTKCSNSACDVL